MGVEDNEYADLTGLRVAVVEDDEDSREILMDLLSTQGAEVRGAASAAEGLALLDAWWPDVLVSDIGLPDLDGYALLARVHERVETTKRDPLASVALTGYATPEERKRAVAAGFTRHVAKPVEGAVFTRMVAEAARNRARHGDPKVG